MSIFENKEEKIVRLTKELKDLRSGLKVQELEERLDLAEFSVVKLKDVQDRLEQCFK